MAWTIFWSFYHHEVCRSGWQWHGPSSGLAITVRFAATDWEHHPGVLLNSRYHPGVLLIIGHLPGVHPISVHHPGVFKITVRVMRYLCAICEDTWLVSAIWGTPGWCPLIE